jgi:hypothetical protein
MLRPSAPFAESNIDSTDRETIPGNQIFELYECPSVRFDGEDATFRTHLEGGESGVVADIRADVDYGHAEGEKSGSKTSFKRLISTEIDRALDPIGQIQFELLTETICLPKTLVRDERIQQAIFSPETKRTNERDCSINHDASVAAEVRERATAIFVAKHFRR